MKQALHGCTPRGALARASAALTALLLLTGCGAGEHICTLRDSPTGISVDVPPKWADRAAEAELVACWDGRCHGGGLRLQKELREAAPSSEPPAPWPGFAVVEGLPEDGRTKVRVELVLRDEGGATVLDERTTLVPKPTYPNGRDCSPGGWQGAVTVTKSGKLTSR
ncbi:hypothetical protein [Streptomyces sp. Da 82-17]|uniref:hypothetical protein n=1 Tax=Streptomyces sp. Da 82-17 TaxID=3377116 RepID=UPI0038D48C9B